MRHEPKFDPQNEYRQQEKLRIGASPSLAERFQELNALEVDLEFYEPQGTRRMSNLKYRVNLANAKAAFSFHCPNGECVGGDFDLSHELAKAVEGGRDMARGEICCQGWLHKRAIDSQRCNHVLRYVLHLDYTQ